MADGLIWTGGFDRGTASLTGNCGAGTNDWCDRQTKRDEQIKIVTDPQFPEACAKFTVQRGDIYVNPRTNFAYSDDRAILTGPSPQCWAKEGDERWVFSSFMFPSDWIGWFPKYDELAAWPARGLGGGSIYNWHHDMGGALEPGSAPSYIIGEADQVVAIIADPRTFTAFKAGIVNPDYPYLRFTAPLKRGQRQTMLMHCIFSADAGKGLWEVWIDGAQICSYKGPTQYPGSAGNYYNIGLYRREPIGDPSLKWQNQGQNVVSYPPGFMPSPGSRVFARDDGYPQSVYIGKSWLGTTRASVEQTTPTALPAQLVADPAKTYPKAEAGRLLLIAMYPQLDARIAALRGEADALEAQSNQIKALLNKGPWW